MGLHGPTPATLSSAVPGLGGSRLEEPHVSQFKGAGIRAIRLRVRNVDKSAVQFLKQVSKGGSVPLRPEIGPNLDAKVRRDPQKVPIEGPVVQPAESQPIRHPGFAPEIRVRDDVSGLEELRVPKVAQRALGPVGSEHPLPECPLVDSVLGTSCYVFTPGSVLAFSGSEWTPLDCAIMHGLDRVRWVVELDRERQRGWVVANHIDGPDRQVLPGYNAMKIDKGGPSDERLCKSAIVRMMGVRTAVAIVERVVVAEPVAVRVPRRRVDRQWDRFENGWLENARGWADQRNPTASDPETFQ